MLFEELTPAQERIIKNICYVQLESFRRIYDNNHRSNDDLIMLLIENEISRDDWNNQLELSMERMKTTGRLPKRINSMNKYELSRFKHILSTLEDEYIDKYPNAVSNLWRKLFLLTDFSDQKFENLN